MSKIEYGCSRNNAEGNRPIVHSPFPQMNENAEAFLRILVENPIFNFAFGLGTLGRQEPPDSESESEGGTPEIANLEKNNEPEVPHKITEETVARCNGSVDNNSRVISVHTEPKLEGGISKEDETTKDGNSNTAAVGNKYTDNGESNRNENENENGNANGNGNKNDNDKDNDVYNDEDDVDDLDYLNEDDYDDYEAYGEDEEQDAEEEEDYDDDYTTNYNHDGDDEDEDNNEVEDHYNEDEMFWNDDDEYNAFHQYLPDTTEHLNEDGTYYNNMDNPDDDDDEENWELEESIIHTQPDYIYPYAYTESSVYPEWNENGHAVIDLTVDNHGNGSNNINHSHNNLNNRNNNRNNHQHQHQQHHQHQHHHHHHHQQHHHHYHHNTNDESEYNIMDFYNENDFDLVYFNRDADDSDADGPTNNQYRNGMTIEEMAKYMT